MIKPRGDIGTVWKVGVPDATTSYRFPFGASMFVAEIIEGFRDCMQKAESFIDELFFINAAFKTKDLTA